MQRNTTRRDRHRRIIARDKPPCGICGEPIDYKAPHLDPGEFTIDHITPLAITGPAGDTLDNLTAAHRKCNRDKSATADYHPGVTYTTTRTW